MLKIAMGAAVAAALTMAAASPAVAYDLKGISVTGEFRGETRSTTVSLHDLDLRDRASIGRAESRLRFASKQVCDVNATLELYNKRDYRACFVPAYTNARGELERRIASVRGR
jgi:UrcA family protein